jgi:hypothetical protein
MFEENQAFCVVVIGESFSARNLLRFGRGTGDPVKGRWSMPYHVKIRDGPGTDVLLQIEEIHAVRSNEVTG